MSNTSRLIVILSALLSLCLGILFLSRLGASANFAVTGGTLFLCSLLVQDWGFSRNGDPAYNDHLLFPNAVKQARIPRHQAVIAQPSRPIIPLDF
jgi:hypothetical protein